MNKKLKVGLFAQNLFREDTATSQIQPVAACQLGGGWALSGGDLQFVHDWKSSQWLSAPVGFQIGKVFKIGSQPVRFAVNPQYNLVDRGGLNEWSVTFVFTALFPAMQPDDRSPPLIRRPFVSVVIFLLQSQTRPSIQPCQ